MKRFNKILVVAFFACSMLLSLAMATSVAAVDDNGLSAAAPPALQASGTGEKIPTKIGAIIGNVLAFVGVLFFALVIYGGLLWMTAGGNEQQVGKAKTLIIDATIGLIIVLSAYAITSYLGTTLTTS